MSVIPRMTILNIMVCTWWTREKPAWLCCDGPFVSAAYPCRLLERGDRTVDHGLFCV